MWAGPSAQVWTTHGWLPWWNASRQRPGSSSLGEGVHAGPDLGLGDEPGRQHDDSRRELRAPAVSAQLRQQQALLKHAPCLGPCVGRQCMQPQLQQPHRGVCTRPQADRGCTGMRRPTFMGYAVAQAAEKLCIATNMLFTRPAAAAAASRVGQGQERG